MRVLWHSNPAWTITGYGTQTALWVPRIAALGHEVAISGPFSFAGAPLAWRGFMTLPAGQDAFGNDVVAGHYAFHRADVMITLCDVFMMDPAPLKDLNVAHWTPVDCEPMGAGDAARLRETGAATIAMSRFGQRQMQAAGFDPYYVPHGVDTRVFAPPASGEAREQVRRDMGIPEGQFVIGLCAANKEGPRKRFWEQMSAFAKFHKKYPDSRLAVHSLIEPRGGVNLRAVAANLGITGAVFFPDQYSYVCGMMNAESLAAWYGALDVLTNVSNEGFGLPAVEAQACGTPVVLMDASTGPELCGSGWEVGGQDDWVQGHDSRWVCPSVDGIAAAYEKAYLSARDGSMAARRDKARQFALTYDVDLVFQKYWMPVLAALDERRIHVVGAADRSNGGGHLRPAAEGVRDLLVVVPSRGAPENVARLVSAVEATATAATDLRFAFDDDDPDLAANTAAAGDGRSVTGPRRRTAERVNEIAAAAADSYRAVAFFTDGLVPGSTGWDTELLAALGTGSLFAYPCDPARPGLPAAMAASSEVVAALGWLCEPSLDHSCLGNVWLDLGKQAGCLAYLPDVTVEALPGAGGNEDVEVRSTGPDEAAYQRWRADRMRADVATVRALRATRAEAALEREVS